MPTAHAPRPFLRAAVVAVLAVAAWWIVTPRASMPPLLPVGDQLVYSASDDPRLPLVEPVLHAPWVDRSSAFTRWLTPVAVVTGASGVAIFAGASPLATLLVVLALVLDASFGASLTHAAGLVMAVGLIWLASGAAFDHRQRVSVARPWFNPLSAILLWGLAVSYHWIAVVCWPIVFAALRRTPQRPGRGLWTLASILVGLVAFVAHFAWVASAARTMAFSPDLSLAWWDGLVVAFDSRPRLPSGSFVSPELTTRVSHLFLMLAGVGVVFGDLARWWRRAILLSGALAAAVAVAWPEWQAEVVRFGSWALAPMVAVGLTWVSGRFVPERRSLALTCGLGAVLLAETIVMGARPLTGLEPRAFSEALASQLEASRAGTTTALVAEDTRTDSALAAWASGRPEVSRVAQHGPTVAAALAEGRVVLAGPIGRRHLELAGVWFTDAFAITDPAPFAVSSAVSALRCATVRADRWSLLPGVEYTGRLGFEVPPSLAGELQVIVGDTLPLQVRAEGPDRRPIPIVADVLLSGPGNAAPPADYWLDGGFPEDAPRVIRRFHLPANPVRATLVALHLGRRSPRVLARLIDFDEAARGRVCAAPLAGAMGFSGEERSHGVSLDSADAFGTGWYGLEGAGDGRFRWADADAVVLLPSAVRTAVQVNLDAAPAVAPGSGESPGPLLTLQVNGVEVASYPMRAGMQRYTWSVPAGTWLAGTNELWWHTSRAVYPAEDGGGDRRALALRVSAIAVTR